MTKFQVDDSLDAVATPIRVAQSQFEMSNLDDESASEAFEAAPASTEEEEELLHDSLDGLAEDDDHDDDAHVNHNPDSGVGSSSERSSTVSQEFLP